MQRSFAGGELAPALAGRGDQTKYVTGLKTCRNFIVRKEGGCSNRPGSPFITEVRNSAVLTYLIKFVFNSDQTYVIEVGNLYFRFIRQGSQIISGGIPFEIATPYVTADLATLQYFQSGDVVTIVHPNYPIMELRRTDHTAWTLTAAAFAPSISPPTNVAIQAPAVAGSVTTWVVTAVKPDTYEESVASASTGANAKPTIETPITIGWTAVSGAQEYNVYKNVNGVFGFIGVAAGTTFTDDNIEPDTSVTPPIARNPFNVAGRYPSTGSFYQQRRVFANLDSSIEEVFASRSGMFNNFTISSPLQDDDAVTFKISGNQVSEVRHMVEINNLIVLTSSGEWTIEGDENGVLRPGAINPRQRGYNGASEVRPVVAGNRLIYVQARGGIIRDMRYDLVRGYEGRDLSIFGSHLFERHTVARMDYAQTPNSIIWVVRSDGTLLGMTYLPDHEVWGWHRHDTDGFYEDVCCVPEGDEDAVYVIVRRTINGVTKRYIERFASRLITDIKTDALFLDSCLSYDGRNTTATTMHLASEIATWDDVVTVTSSTSTFTSADVGNAIVVVSGDERVSIKINEFVGPFVVKGIASNRVPESLRDNPVTTWERAVDSLGGLEHLEGKSVSVFADGNVVANPNNEEYEQVTVSNGSITLGRAYSIIHVGLPYVCDFGSLELDLNDQQIRDRMKNIREVSLLVMDTRGLFVGKDFPAAAADSLVEGLTEKEPEQITTYGDPVPDTNGLTRINIESSWDEAGRFVVRQVDPLPATILSAIPSGDVGE